MRVVVLSECLTTSLTKVATIYAGNGLLVGYNWSLTWSLSASGFTVWPGEGAWGGWATGGSPCDKGMALGTIPSTAVGSPGGATLTTPGGYLLKEEEREGRYARGIVAVAELKHF